MAGNLIDPERFAGFQDDFGGESERFLQAVVDGWRQLRERLARTVSEQDRHALAEAAHTLASECMLIGAAALQGAARDLEQLGRQGDAASDADLERALADIEQLWPATERALLERTETC